MTIMKKIIMVREIEELTKIIIELELLKEMIGSKTESKEPDPQDTQKVKVHLQLMLDLKDQMLHPMELTVLDLELVFRIMKNPPEINGQTMLIIMEEENKFQTHGELKNPMIIMLLEDQWDGEKVLLKATIRRQDPLHGVKMELMLNQNSIMIMIMLRITGQELR